MVTSAISRLCTFLSIKSAFGILRSGFCKNSKLPFQFHQPKRKMKVGVNDQKEGGYPNSAPIRSSILLIYSRPKPPTNFCLLWTAYMAFLLHDFEIDLYETAFS